jgi:hypothetical protein
VPDVPVMLLAAMLGWAAQPAPQAESNAARTREAALCRMNLSAVLRQQAELSRREGELRRRLAELTEPEDGP